MLLLISTFSAYGEGGPELRAGQYTWVRDDRPLRALTQEEYTACQAATLRVFAAAWLAWQPDRARGRQENAKMCRSQLYRISGLGLVIGAVVFVVHVVMRSLLTAGADPSTFARHGLWVPANVLGFLGAVLVLMGLPAMYARVAAPAGLLGLVGVVLIALAWTFFGVFLSLYAALLLPWLADKAPALVAATAPLPAEFIVAFIAGSLAWLAGTVVLAIPFIRGHLQPGWVGYVLSASALWLVVGNFIIAPGGPAPNPAINLLANLAPVLLLVAVGYLGSRLWGERVGVRDRAEHQ